MKQASISVALSRVERKVPVHAVDTYRFMGVKSFAGGCFDAGEKSGSETRYKELRRVAAGDIVYPKLMAWEGAFAIVPTEFDGFVVSPEFCTFVVNTDAADPGYLSYFLRRPESWYEIAGRSSGTNVRRRRLYPDQFLSAPMHLPDVTEQREIASRLDRELTMVQEVANRLEEGSEDRVLALYPDIVQGVLDRATPARAPVGELTHFVNDIVRPGEPAEPAEVFVGLQHVESHTGRCIGQLPLGGEKGRKFRFQPGDIVYGYLRPYLNKVWVADRHGLCSVDQYVLRSKAGVTSDYLAHALRSRATLDQAIAMTHNLQLPRLRSGLLSQIQIPMVPAGMMGHVTADLDRMLSMVVQARDRRSHQRRLANALTQSILNHAFAFPA